MLTLRILRNRTEFEFKKNDYFVSFNIFTCIYFTYYLVNETIFII